MYLGLDLGTSGLRALLIDARQRVQADASAPLRFRTLHPGWSEQDPADWITAARSAMDAVRRAAPDAFAAVRSMGLSGQMHGATVLGPDDTPLRPCILWNDVRSAEEAAAMDADPAFREITGNIVFPGFTAPKIAWLREHEPEVARRIARILLPKDYLRLWLTGAHVSDMSDSAGTAWLDMAARDWSDTLLGRTGLDRSHMPDLVEGSAVSGTLRDGLASELGLPRGVAVAGGAGDNAAAACGLGVTRGGAAFASIGTSGVLFAATDGFRPNAASAVHAFCHALPDTWHQMGVILSAGNCLSWFSELVGRDPGDLLDALPLELQAPGAPMFLPYLAGERTPHNDAAQRGAFLDMSHATDLAGLTQAVLEGVAFAFADNLAACQQAGARIDRILAVGGGARSRYLLQALSTAMGVPVDLPEGAALGACLGAARLAMLADGAPAAEVLSAPEISDSIAPDGGLADAFAARHAAFRDSYARLARDA